MSETTEFYKLIDLAMDLEKAILSAGKDLNYLFIFHDDGELIIEAFYSNPYDINPEMVGGLIAAINGFAGGVKEGNNRLVVLQKVKFLFTKVADVLFVIAYNTDLGDEEANKVMDIVSNTFKLSYLHEVESTDDQPVDTMACTALSKIFQLIDDEVIPEYKLGKKTVLDLDLVEYEASKRIQELFLQYREAEEKAKEAEAEPTVSPDEESVLMDFDEPSEDALAMDESQSVPTPTSSGESQSVPTPTSSGEEVPPAIAEKFDEEGDAMIQAIMQMENLLDQMISRFETLLGLTVIRNHPEMGLETIEKGELEPEVFEKLLSTVLENIHVINSLLHGTLEDRILELDNYYMYLQAITNTSFMYLIFTDKSSIELIQPIIERVANTIATIYPE